MATRNISVDDLLAADSKSQSAQKFINDYDADSNTFVQALKNVPSSARQFGNDIIQPFIHPIKTAKSIGQLISGTVQLFTEGEQENEALARAVGDFYKQRYGSLEQIKQTLATDPVGLLSDLSVVLTGGGTLAAKLPAAAGNVGKIASTVGKVVDPINVAAKGVAAASPIVSKPVTQVLGMTTGAGGRAISEAFQSGAEGGARADAFLDNMRGKVPSETVIGDAFASMKALQQKSKKEYLKGIDELKLGEQAIDFAKIEKAIDDLLDQKKYKGIYTISDNAIKKVEAIQKHIADWKANKGLHNAKGIDMLKKKIDAEYPTGIKVGDAGVIVTQIRNAVKNAIIKEVPKYKDVMKAYEDAISLEQKLAKELSLGNRKAAGTTLRKLQSVMRDNVNTNFGQRFDFVKKLDEAGLDKNIIPSLAGQSLQTFAPQGLQRLTGTSTLGGVATGLIDPITTAGLLVAQSPRAVGETAFKLGQASRFAGNVVPRVATASRILRPFGLLSNQSQALENRGLLQ
jgi:hypothetical protein